MNYYPHEIVIRWVEVFSFTSNAGVLPTSDFSFDWISLVGRLVAFTYEKLAG